MRDTGYRHDRHWQRLGEHTYIDRDGGGGEALESGTVSSPVHRHMDVHIAAPKVPWLHAYARAGRSGMEFRQVERVEIDERRRETQKTTFPECDSGRRSSDLLRMHSDLPC